MLALQPATAVRDQPTMRLLGLPCRLVDTGKLTCHLRVFDPDGTMTDRSLQPVRMLVRNFGAWRSGSKLQPLPLTFEAISGRHCAAELPYSLRNSSQQVAGPVENRT